MIIDSNLDFESAIGERINDIPKDILERLVILDVEYYSFDNLLHRGQIIVRDELVKEVEEMFSFMREIKFPVNKVVPISHYKNDDILSMSDNNSSAFNYRFVYNTNRLSLHSYGIAVDINPMLNPYHVGDEIFPRGAIYNTEVLGTFSKDSPVVQKFYSLGWHWGGIWEEKDYHHFWKKELESMRD